MTTAKEREFYQEIRKNRTMQGRNMLICISYILALKYDEYLAVIHIDKLRQNI